MPEGWLSVAGGTRVSLDQLKTIAQTLLLTAGENRVWLIEGEMGSGKTTLIKVIGGLLGVTETMSSPTFSIVNEYGLPEGRKMFHFDLYRLKNEKEVFEIGVEEYFDSGDRCLVEWPEKLGSLTPATGFRIRITVLDPQHRRIEFRQN